MTRTDAPGLAFMLGERMREFGDRTALWADGADAATYRELLQLSTDIGSHLAALAGVPRTAVAVVGRPGLGLYAGVLGALLSGHVPALVDSAQPVERIRQTLELVDPSVVAWCDAPPEGLPWAGPALSVDGAGRGVAIPAARHGGAGSFGPGVGYLGFTSGSRGLPRAIVGSAAGLGHFLAWQARTFRIGGSARFGQLTSPGFDVFYRDLLTPLTSGALICVPGAEQLAGGRVIEWLAEARVTHLHAVPSLARYWLRAGRPATPRLEITFFAGESLDGALVGDWRAATGPDQRVVNLYGAAEATLAQAFYEVPTGCGPAPQPVGTPLPGIRARMVDPDGRECAPGETGEIVIESPWLSHGYLSRDGDPTRLSSYRTGDRGRRTEAGLLHVVGRLDREVKIRGVRVNLDEVAAVLIGHPLVDNAVVVTGTDPLGGLRIEAHVAVTAEDAPAGGDLRRYLAARLPGQMVPGVFHVRPELPLGATGKVSARALEASPTRGTDSAQRTERG